MGQLLVTLIVPPVVGVVTYIIIRRIWDRDEIGAVDAVRNHDPSVATPAEGPCPLKSDQNQRRSNGAACVHMIRPIECRSGSSTS